MKSKLGKAAKKIQKYKYNPKSNIKIIMWNLNIQKLPIKRQIDIMAKNKTQLWTLQAERYFKAMNYGCTKDERMWRPPYTYINGKIVILLYKN